MQQTVNGVTTIYVLDMNMGLTPVYVFDGDTYISKSGTTDESGQVSFVLPDGDYRFRANFGSVEVYSDTANHCTVPACDAVSITAPHVAVTVTDQHEAALAGVPVYVFDGTTYTNISGTTDENGVAEFTLPDGDYRFRADVAGTQLYSGETNHCDLTTCDAVSITAYQMTFTVDDQDGELLAGIPVYVFEGDTYISKSGTTDENGQVDFTLDAGTYRFRADVLGTQIFSADCDVTAGCESAAVTANFVQVTVLDGDGAAVEPVLVYVFDEDGYTSQSAATDANGVVEFVLLPGAYRFRADVDGVQYWSSESNNCTVPGCVAAQVDLPAAEPEVGQVVETTITYVYDPLYRLSEANYDNGLYFQYTYDAVGNRLSQVTADQTNAYTYDAANRLTSLDGIAYTWDNNGNLLNDGASTYTYTYANRLETLADEANTYSYAYNGLGDRVQQTANGVTVTYQLDMNMGLTQVLDDGTSTYLYGLSRIGETNGDTWDYYMVDALGSVRQLTDDDGAVTLAESFTPYGETLSLYGEDGSSFGYAGEMTDESGLQYLRARYMNPALGRFISRDTWGGDYNQPHSFNHWNYVNGNPVMFTDPSGNIPFTPPDLKPCVDSKCNEGVGIGIFCYPIDMTLEEMIKEFEVELTSEPNGSWIGKENEKEALLFALIITGDAIKRVLGNNYSTHDAFKAVFNPLKFEMCNPKGPLGIETCERWINEKDEKTGEIKSVKVRDVNSGMITRGHTTISVSGNLGIGLSLVNNFIHELGHVFNNTLETAPETAMDQWNIEHEKYHRITTSENYGFYGTKFPWQQAVYNVGSGSEDFADSFLGWTYDLWEIEEDTGLLTDAGVERQKFMNTNMPTWISGLIP